MRGLFLCVVFICGCLTPQPQKELCEASGSAPLFSLEGLYSTIEDGSTTISEIELLPNGEYRWSSVGCFSVAQTTGTFQHEGDTLLLVAKKSTPFADAPQVLHLRHWRERNLLLRPEEVALFDASPVSSVGYLQENKR